MSKELAARLTPLASSGAPTSAWLQTTGIVLGGSALAAVCAHVSLPLYFTPVPLSMAPFTVLLLGLLLSPRMAAATFAAYLAEGALGLPVFAPSPLASGGLAHLFGPTGGYLLAYPLAAALISFLWRRTKPAAGRGFSAALFSAAAGNLAILGGGGLWLAVLTHASAQSILTLAVLPFLPGDALKIAAAAALAVGFQRLRQHNP
jgi:biotin transport system substrate-specific component